MPNETLLNQLKERLLEKPDCAPSCASSPRLLLEATPTTLRLRIEVLAGAATAVPLPGNEKHWLPRTVIVDGKPASALTRGAAELSGAEKGRRCGACARFHSPATYLLASARVG